LLGGGTTEQKTVEIPAPKSKEDYQALYESSLKILKDHVSSVEGWTKANTQEGFDLFEKVEEGKESLHLVKTQGILKVSLEKAYALVSDTSMESRKRWDTELLYYNVVETITDNILLTHVGFNTPFPVTCRDFCAIRCTTEEDGVRYIWGCSIINSAVPEDTTGKFVRGMIIVSGFVFKPVDGEPDQCLIANVNQVDPKGWIPAWVVNLGKGKTLARMTGMKKILEESA